MGKGRAPTVLEYNLINKTLRKYEERDKKTSIKERRENFNREFNKWLDENKR